MTNEAHAQDGDETLLFTQQMRRRLVRHYTNNGQSMPADPKDARTMLVALSDMDRQVMGQKKLAVDEGLGNKMVAAASIMAQVFNDKRVDQFNKQPMPGVQARGTDEIIIPDDAETVVQVPGEMGAIGSVETFDSFLGRMKDQAQAAA